jgi:hypothetical protein
VAEWKIHLIKFVLCSVWFSALPLRFPLVHPVDKEEFNWKNKKKNSNDTRFYRLSSSRWTKKECSSHSLAWHACISYRKKSEKSFIFTFASLWSSVLISYLSHTSLFMRMRNVRKKWNPRTNFYDPQFSFIQFTFIQILYFISSHKEYTIKKDW